MNSSLQNDLILEVKKLKKYFPITHGFLSRVKGYVRAVDGVSFQVRTGETMGLVGESGCGKTTVARSILRAIDPTAGEILFRMENGSVVNMSELTYQELKRVRRHIQLIFQDPFSSLNPRLPVIDIVSEPLKTHGWKRPAYEQRVRELLDLVGLSSSYMRRYPHAFSGGQRQRIGIARALALSPSLIVADEPVSALDVSVQAQLLNLIHDLKEQLQLTVLIIAHDLSVIRYICDRVVVMYLGRIAEVAGTDALFTRPLHPYTSALIAAVPDADPHAPWHGDTITGEVTAPPLEPKGCLFASRCPHAEPHCHDVIPDLRVIEDTEAEEVRWVACHRADDLDLQGVV